MQDITIKTSTLSKVFFKEVLPSKELENLFWKAEKFPGFNAFCQEVFHRFYYDAEPNYLEHSAPEYNYAKKLHEQSFNLSDFEELTLKTQGRLDLSKIATKKLIEQLLINLEPPSYESIESLREQVRQLQSRLEQETNPEKLETLKTKIEAFQKRGKLAAEKAINYGQSLEAESIITDAIDEADQVIDNYMETAEALGCGNETGSNQQVSIEEKLKLINLLSQSRQLKDIVKLIGRMKDSFARKQREKSASGFHELVGITRGNDLARVTPGELIKLANPETESLFYSGYLQQSLMQYEIKGKQPQETGPIILCIDDSGSMNKWENFSKALGVTLATEATKAGRDVWILMFDTRTKKYHFRGGYSGDILEFIGHRFMGGGTDFDKPLKAAIDILKDEPKADKADVLFISDGECYLYDESLLDNKQFTIFGLLTGRSRSGLEFCDKLYQIKSVDDLDNLFMELA